jgi:trehalose 6-phosphate phosphatase
VLPPFQTNWALFLDLDGTLLELVDRPDDARARPEVLELLSSIGASNGGALALVSGRSIEQIDEILDPLRPPAAGQHGYERRSASGRITRADLDVSALAPIRDKFRRFAESHPGSVVEDKGASVALHYRRAPEAERDVDDLARALAGEIPDRFRLQRGKKVLEIKPSGRTKGTAIAAFMEEEPFRGRSPVFFGDDVTDEDGFRYVNEAGGITIKVGSEETRARYRLESVSAVADWLARYERFLEKR